MTEVSYREAHAHRADHASGRSAHFVCVCCFLVYINGGMADLWLLAAEVSVAAHELGRWPRPSIRPSTWWESLSFSVCVCAGGQLASSAEFSVVQLQLDHAEKDITAAHQLITAAAHQLNTAALNAIKLNTCTHLATHKKTCLDGRPNASLLLLPFCVQGELV